MGRVGRQGGEGAKKKRYRSPVPKISRQNNGTAMERHACKKISPPFVPLSSRYFHHLNCFSKQICCFLVFCLVFSTKIIPTPPCPLKPYPCNLSHIWRGKKKIKKKSIRSGGWLVVWNWLQLLDLLDQVCLFIIELLVFRAVSVEFGQEVHQLLLVAEKDV